MDNIVYMMSQGSDLGKACREILNTDPVDAYITRYDYDDLITETVYHMREGETSDVIFSKGVYVIFNVVNAYDEQRSEENKEKILRMKQKEQIGVICRESGLDLYSELHEDRWDAVTMDDSVSFSSPSFIEVYYDVFK